MPADASVYGLQQPVKLNTPFENLSQVLQVRSQQQAIESNRALAQERQQQIAAQQRLAQSTHVVDGLMQTAFDTDPDTGVSTFNRDKFQQGLAQSGQGHLYPQYAEMLDKMDQSSQKIAAEKRALVARTIMGIQQAGNTPESVLSGLAYLKKNGAISDDHVQPVLQEIAKNPTPENIGGMMTRLAGALPEYQDLLHGEEKRKADLGLVQANTLKSNAEAAKANRDETPITEAALDQRFQVLRQKQLTGQGLSGPEKAELDSYRERKLLGPEASAIAAANRQARSIDAATAQQGRAQDFTEKQAGRTELTAKVEQPYLDAKEKADTMRSVIAAARGGNMTAASVQSLMGVLGLVTTEGVKRINTTELSEVQGAGSLLERLKGAAGRVVAGQPLSAKVQGDLEELSGILEKSAEKKYVNGFNAVTKRYQLSDEQPLVRPATPAAPSSAPANETPEQRIKRLLGGG